MPTPVRITDVSPRDGLQNESRAIPTDEKARLVELLCKTGVDEIEVSSFVSRRWIPQLGDAPELFAIVAGFKPTGMVFSALVPNDQGLDAALRVNEQAGRRVIDRVAVFTAASDTFARKNINASITDSLKRLEPVIARAKREGLGVRGYVSCAVACPFEGEIAPEKVTMVGGALSDLGADEIDLADTIGAAEPADITLLLNAWIARMGDPILRNTTLHLHDTFGRAAECVAESLQLGVRSFDGAAAGLGGCPYASTPGRRAPGNIDTSLLAATIEGSGYGHRVDRAALDAAGKFAASIRSAGGRES